LHGAAGNFGEASAFPSGGDTEWGGSIWSAGTEPRLCFGATGKACQRQVPGIATLARGCS